MWLSVLAQAVAAAAPAPESALPTPPPAAVGEIEVITRVPVIGDLQQGIQAYRQEFFTAVRPGTAMDMIQWLPGFIFEDTRDLRGLGGAVGNVLIDGQPPTSKTDTLATVLRRTPASQVDRIDIIVGGAPGIDMRGRSVIANVVLKKTQAPRGQVTAGLFFYGHGQVFPVLQANATRKNDTTTAEGSILIGKPVMISPIMGSGRVERRDSQGALIFAGDQEAHGRIPYGSATGSYEFPAIGGRLRVNGMLRYNEAGFVDEISVTAPEPALFTNAADQTTFQSELGLRFERAFGRTTLETQLLRRRNADALESVNRRPPTDVMLTQENVQNESVARATLRFKKDENLSFEGSAEGALNRLETSSSLTVGGAPSLLPNANVDVCEHRGEVGALLAWKPSSAWNVTGALKVETSALASTGDAVRERNLAYVKPRLALTLVPNGKTQLRFRVEHEVSQINFYDYVAYSEFGSGLVRAGNPDLKPRRAWVAEGVLERQFWPGASVVATVRHTDIRDVLDQMVAPGQPAATIIDNIGGGSRFDLIATVTLPLARFGLDGLTVKGTVNHASTRVTDPTTGELRPSSFIQAWSGDAHIAHDLPQWKLNWGVDAVYQGAWTLYRPSVIEAYGPQLSLTAFVEHRPRADLNLRFEVGNVTGASPLRTLSVYGGPRPLSAVSYIERARLGEGPHVLVRVRKSLN